MSYAAFVAPAMLAASAMNGALAETTFNFFGKMKSMKLYDGVIATPVRPFEIALGELIWAMIRGSAYSAAFLWPDGADGPDQRRTGAGGLPGGGAGRLRLRGARHGVRDVPAQLAGLRPDQLGQFVLFLFSGTFVPLERYPAALRWLIELTPLYRTVHLIRGITLGTADWTLLLDVVYLLAAVVIGLAAAGRRVDRLLCK